MHNVTFRIEKINLTLFMMSVFLILSFLFDRGLFTEVGDGFFYQLESVRKSEELGSLWFIHNFRYYLVSPFLIFDNFAYQSLVFFIYIWFPGFFLRGRLRIAVYILLFFSLFFSYRSVLTMASISYLVSSVIMEKKSTFILMYSLALAFLSTGSVVIYMVIFYLYRKKIFRNEMMLITFNVFLLTVVFALSGAFIHKALFFLDQDIYGSATNTSIGNLTAIGFNDILTIIKNVVSRGVLIEAISDKPVRFVVILLFSCFVLFNVFFKAKKLDLLLFVLFVFGCLMEGLTLYCLFSSIIMLSFYKLPRFYKNRFSITLIA